MAKTFKLLSFIVLKVLYEHKSMFVMASQVHFDSYKSVSTDNLEDFLLNENNNTTSNLLCEPPYYKCFNKISTFKECPNVFKKSNSFPSLFAYVKKVYEVLIEYVCFLNYAQIKVCLLYIFPHLSTLWIFFSRFGFLSKYILIVMNLFRIGTYFHQRLECGFMFLQPIFGTFCLLEIFLSVGSVFVISLFYLIRYALFYDYYLEDLASENAISFYQSFLTFFLFIIALNYLKIEKNYEKTKFHNIILLGRRG